MYGNSENKYLEYFDGCARSVDFAPLYYPLVQNEKHFAARTDKKDELERRRRQRKMARANEEAEFLRQQEAKAEAHNQRMLKGVFDAMDDDKE